MESTDSGDLKLRIILQGCHQVLKVGGPSRALSDNFRWARFNSGGSKHKNNPSN